MAVRPFRLYVVLQGGLRFMLGIPSLSAEIDSDIYAMEYARCTAGGFGRGKWAAFEKTGPGPLMLNGANAFVIYNQCRGH